MPLEHPTSYLLIKFLNNYILTSNSSSTPSDMMALLSLSKLQFLGDIRVFFLKFEVTNGSVVAILLTEDETKKW